jgi:putative transposase
MPKRLKRIYGFSHLRFITSSCYRRLPLLGSAHARNVFVQILNEVRDQFGFALVGFVVMPEHVHLLIGEPKRGNLRHPASLQINITPQSIESSAEKSYVDRLKCGSRWKPHSMWSYGD